MEDDTETTLQPGPYLHISGETVTFLGGPIDDDGDVIVINGVHEREWSYYAVTDLTPADHWPEWWPFQDAALPERTPQVGDWVRHKDWGVNLSPEFLMGNHLGQWQLVDKCGNAYSLDSLDNFFVVPAPEGVDQ